MAGARKCDSGVRLKLQVNEKNRKYEYIISKLANSVSSMVEKSENREFRSRMRRLLRCDPNDDNNATRQRLEGYVTTAGINRLKLAISPVYEIPQDRLLSNNRHKQTKNYPLSQAPQASSYEPDSPDIEPIRKSLSCPIVQDAPSTSMDPDSFSPVLRSLSNSPLVRYRTLSPPSSKRTATDSATIESPPSVPSPTAALSPANTPFQVNDAGDSTVSESEDAPLTPVVGHEDSPSQFNDAGDSSASESRYAPFSPVVGHEDSPSRFKDAGDSSANESENAPLTPVVGHEDSPSPFNDAGDSSASESRYAPFSPVVGHEDSPSRFKDAGDSSANESENAPLTPVVGHEDSPSQFNDAGDSSAGESRYAPFSPVVGHEDSPSRFNDAGDSSANEGDDAPFTPAVRPEDILHTEADTILSQLTPFDTTGIVSEKRTKSPELARFQEGRLVAEPGGTGHPKATWFSEDVDFYSSYRKSVLPSGVWSSTFRLKSTNNFSTVQDSPEESAPPLCIASSGPLSPLNGSLSPDLLCSSRNGIVANAAVTHAQNDGKYGEPEQNLEVEQSSQRSLPACSASDFFSPSYPFISVIDAGLATTSKSAVEDPVAGVQAPMMTPVTALSISKALLDLPPEPEKPDMFSPPNPLVALTSNSRSHDPELCRNGVALEVLPYKRPRSDTIFSP